MPILASLNIITYAAYDISGCSSWELADVEAVVTNKTAADISLAVQARTRNVP